MGSFSRHQLARDILVPGSLDQALRAGPLYPRPPSPARTVDVDDLELLRFPPVRHLGILCSSAETGAPVVGLPLHARADVLHLEGGYPLVEDLPPDVSPAGLFVRKLLPLGTLGTDHRGYASWDLARLGLRLRRRARDDEFRAAVTQNGRLHAPWTRPDAPELPLDERLRPWPTWRTGDAVLIRLEILPWEDEGRGIDALATGDVGPERVLVRRQWSLDDLADRALGRGLVSMQTPSLLDWEVSPSSFTLGAGQWVGEDGCESFLPPVLSTQQFHFARLLRGPLIEPDPGARVPRSVRLGYLHHHVAEWFHLGHSLGNLRHSVALAPAERTRIAVVEWSRRDAARRDEQQRLGESLDHAQRRDRDVSDTMTMALDEVQRGESTQGGVGAALGAAGAFLSGGAGVVLSGALSAVFGGSESVSEGHRDLAARSLQRVSDALQQSSTSLRELNATVVIEVGQEEDARATTRLVANYNHGHTLTILYYEVLRHYRVVTRHHRTTPLLLVTAPLPPRFDVDLGANLPGVAWGAPGPSAFVDVLAWETVLRGNLLDPRLSGGFDALRRIRGAVLTVAVQSGRPAGAAPPDPWARPVDRLELIWRIGRGSNEEAQVVVQLHVAGASARDVAQDGLRSRATGGDNRFDDWTPEGAFAQCDIWNSDPIVTVRALRGITFRLVDDAPLHMDDLRVVAHVGADQHELLHLPPVPTGAVLKLGEEAGMRVQTRSFREPPAPPAAAVAPTFLDLVQPSDVVAADALLAHLQARAEHYLDQCHLHLSVARRRALLAQHDVAGVSLLHLVDDQPVAVHGGRLAFPLTPSGLAHLREVAGLAASLDAQALEPSVVVEDLVTLPTRGVFAEAKLGRCNANEIIDPTRFWDWQISPIPDALPDIAPVSTDSRNAAPGGLAPSAWPAPVVVQAAPQALPDPTGLAEALRVLGSSALFRDMSGKEALSTLLGSVGGNAAGLARSLGEAAANSELRTLQKQVLDANLPAADKAKLLEALAGPANAQAKPAPTPTPTPGGVPTPGSTVATGTGSGLAAIGGGGGGGGGGAKPSIRSDQLGTEKEVLFHFVPQGFERADAWLPARPIVEGVEVSHLAAVTPDGRGVRGHVAEPGPDQVLEVEASGAVAVGFRCTERNISTQGMVRIELYAAKRVTALTIDGSPVTLPAALQRLTGNHRFRQADAPGDKLRDLVRVWVAPQVKVVTKKEATAAALKATLEREAQSGLVLGFAPSGTAEVTIPDLPFLKVGSSWSASAQGSRTETKKTGTEQNDTVTVEYQASLYVLTGALLTSDRAFPEPGAAPTP